MRVADTSLPEAVLAQLIALALLALVAEAVELGLVAGAARDGMLDVLDDGEAMEDVEPDEAGRARVRQRHAQEVVDGDRFAQVEARVRQARRVAERRLLEHRLGQREHVAQVRVEFAHHEYVLRRVADQCENV